MQYRNLNEAVEAYTKQYEDYPGWVLMHERTREEVLAILNECLSKGKSVYQLGYVKTVASDVLL